MQSNVRRKIVTSNLAPVKTVSCSLLRLVFGTRLKSLVRCAAYISVAVFCCVTAPLGAAPVKYRVVSAGALNGESNSPSSINAQGDIVGHGPVHGTGIPVSTPFLFRDGVMYDLSAYGMSA